MGQDGLMEDLSNESPIGRLLEELSWEGNARKYRAGGRGVENVLVTEVFAALDLLPRATFLGEILSAGHGAESARQAVWSEIEQVVIDVLPYGPDLAAGGPNIQPDLMFHAPSATVLVEAKRIRAGAFQPEQLAREYLTLMRDHQTPTRLLLLILPAPPPFPVRGRGRLGTREAILGALPAVHARAADPPPLPEMIAGIQDTVAWTTWSSIDEAMHSGLGRLNISDPSVDAAIRRCAHAVSRAIAWHA